MVTNLKIYMYLQYSAMGNAQEMVKQAKILAEATSSLVNAIKREAQDERDHDARKRLLDAAKALADATSKMVEAAKIAAKNPNVRIQCSTLCFIHAHSSTICVNVLGRYHHY